jgi:hypothetical protein
MVGTPPAAFASGDFAHPTLWSCWGAGSGSRLVIAAKTSVKQRIGASCCPFRPHPGSPGGKSTRNAAVLRSECAVYMVGGTEKSADPALSAGAPQP